MRHFWCTCWGARCEWMVCMTPSGWVLLRIARNMTFAAETKFEGNPWMTMTQETEFKWTPIFFVSVNGLCCHILRFLQLWAKTSRCRGHFTWKTTAPTLDAPRFAKIQRLKWNNDEQRNQYVAAWVLRDPKRLVSHSVNYKLPPRECPGPSSVGHLHGYGSHSGNWRVSTWATDHFMAM